MEDEESTKSFRVVDKRRFSSSGDHREGSASGDEKGGAFGDSGFADKKTPQRDEAQSASGASVDSSPEVDFSSFIFGLYTQVLFMLGEVPHPETNERVENVEAAKQIIDILGMLEEKTKGNLSDGEAKMIAEVLTHARMAYVDKVGRRVR